MAWICVVLSLLSSIYIVDVTVSVIRDMLAAAVSDDGWVDG